MTRMGSELYMKAISAKHRLSQAQLAWLSTVPASILISGLSCKQLVTLLWCCVAAGSHAADVCTHSLAGYCTLRLSRRTLRPVICCTKHRENACNLSSTEQLGCRRKCSSSSSSSSSSSRTIKRIWSKGRLQHANGLLPGWCVHLPG